MLSQKFGCFRMSPFICTVQRGPSFGIERINLGAVFKEEVHHWNIAVASGDMKSCHTVSLDRVNISPLI
jgi:hypothetical protein